MELALNGALVALQFLLQRAAVCDEQVDWLHAGKVLLIPIPHILWVWLRQLWRHLCSISAVTWKVPSKRAWKR